MPRPSVNTVLQMAYVQACLVAKQPVTDRDNPKMLQAVEDLWSLVKDRLPVNDPRVRRLDELMTALAGGQRSRGD